MWMFLTLDNSDLGNFLYFLFDTDRSGELDVNEIKNIISLVHHQLLNSRTSVQRLLEELSKKNHKLSAEEFTAWTKANPSLLEPVFHLHLELRNQLLGNHFWQTLQTRRYTTSVQTNPKYIFTLQKLLDEISKSETTKQDIPKSKRIHPATATRQNTKEDHVITHKKTEEKNSVVLDDHAVVRKKSDVEQVAKKKSDVDKMSHNKSDVERSNPFDRDIDDDDDDDNNELSTNDKKRHHHHHHHSSHHSGENEAVTPTSQRSHHHHHHHSRHHNSENEAVTPTRSHHHHIGHHSSNSHHNSSGGHSPAPAHHH